jgi:hypothetical protein
MNHKFFYVISLLFIISHINAHSVLVEFPGNAIQSGLAINFVEDAYGPGFMANFSYLGMIELGIQYNLLYEQGGNYKTRNLIPHIKYFPLKPFSRSNLQPSLEFYYRDETYYLKNFYVEKNPRRFFYRIGGSFSYKKKLRKIYTVIPELGIFRTVQKLEGVNLRVEGIYPVYFIYNDYRDTNNYVELKFSFCLIRPLNDDLDLVIQFQNFMNRDEFQDQFLLSLIRYF